VLAAALALPAASAEAATDPCPPGDYSPQDDGALSDETRSRARNWEFSFLERPYVSLRPPVRWNQDPFDSEPWRKKLHSQVAMGTLLMMYSRFGEDGALVQARDLMLDWIKGNPTYKGIGWQDKITGGRTRRLAYMLAAAQCDGILTDGQRSTLRRSAEDHGRWLADPDNYRPGNHGLFDDQGLLQLALYLPSLPKADEWRRLAARRFVDGLPIHREEYVGLEHSPGYHFNVLNQVEDVLALPGEDDPILVETLRRMREVASWFVMPDGTVTRLGDTGRGTAPDWAIEQAEDHTGIAPTLRSGFGIVSDPARDAYLSVAAGHHRFGHKQADELTFELYDRGRHIVTDTGRYGALRDDDDSEKVEALEFTKSSRAHSVLLVDGKSFPYDDRKPYGSGLEGSGGGAGWWALEGTNRLLRRSGVRHSRLFVYKPGEALVVVDRVRSRKRHSYTRLFQFDPGVTVSEGSDERTWRLAADGFDGTLFNAPAKGDRGSDLVFGQRNPLLGFTTPEDKFADLIPRHAVVHRSRGKSLDHVSLITLDGAGTACLVSGGDGVTVRLALDGAAPIHLTIVRDGDRLTVSESPAPTSTGDREEASRRDDDEDGEGEQPAAEAPPAEGAPPAGEEPEPAG
jgi:hypothetical protein